MNTGLDSIIETWADYSTGTAHVSRYLIQFDQTEIDSLYDNYINPLTASYTVDLINYAANVQNLNVDTRLEVYAVSGSWGMGTGHFNDNPYTTNGCNWKYRTYEGTNEWVTSGFESGVTGSYGSVAGGGNWWTDTETADKIFSYSSNKDLKVSVKGIISAWYSGSKGLSGDLSIPLELPFELGIGAITNDGFIVKQDDRDEFVANRNKQAKLQFYSVDTNTIYPPELQFKWDDFIHSTSSAISTIDTTELVASLDNNPGEFRRDSVHRFKINCRPRFPARTYSTSSIYLTQHYLPVSASC